MGFYTGRTGSLSYGGKRVAKVRDWSVNTSVQLLSTNTIDTASDTFTPGVKSITGSATLIYYRLETGDVRHYRQFTDLLKKVMKVGAASSDDRVQLQLATGPAPEDQFTINAYLSSVEVGSRTSELSVVPVRFTVDGDFVSTIT